MTTWPLTILYFQRFSLIALFVNPLILPLQPPLMILTGAAALLGTIWLPMGRLAALFAWPFPALTIRLVTFFARFADGGLGLSGLSPWFLVGYYIVLIGGSIAIRELQKHNSIWASLEPLIDTLRARAVWLLIAAALVTGIIWQSAARAPDGNLHLTFFDVGAGDAILIESPAGQNILVDGGSSPTLLMNHLGYKLPLLQRKIDWLVIGGTRSNQTAGLLGLSDHLRLEHVLMPPVSGSYSFQRLQNELTDAGINLHLAERGQRLDLGEGASVEVIDCSSAGLILLVRHHNARILLPTGLTPELHPVMNSDHRVRSVSAMLLPDGGHNSVNSPGWLKHTDPTIVIISVDASEGINRPAAEVLDALGERSILRTDRSGTLELHTDGIVLWLESERDPTD